jgi:hypothetical protein
VLRRVLRCEAMSEPVRSLMQASGVAVRDASAVESDLGFLWDFWYPAVRSTAVTGKQLVTAMLLEVPLVLGRTSEGKAFAMRDSCPHRAGDSTERPSNAAITVGDLMLAADSVLRFLR